MALQGLRTLKQHNRKKQESATGFYVTKCTHFVHYVHERCEVCNAFKQHIMWKVTSVPFTFFQIFSMQTMIYHTPFVVFVRENHNQFEMVWETNGVMILLIWSHFHTFCKIISSMLLKQINKGRHSKVKKCLQEYFFQSHTNILYHEIFNIKYCNGQLLPVMYNLTSNSGDETYKSSWYDSTSNWNRFP